MAVLTGRIFAGHLRSIVGSMTVEEIVTERQKLATEVLDGSKAEMVKMGLIVDSLQIQSIDDMGAGYIDAMAAPHNAAIQRQAKIAQAQANQAAAEAEQESQRKQAEYQRQTAIVQAKYKAEAAASHNRVALDRMLIDQLPQIVREAAGGLANANINVLNGADGLGQLAAGLVGQGLSIYESIKSGLGEYDAEEDEDRYEGGLDGLIGLPPGLAEDADEPGGSAACGPGAARGPARSGRERWWAPHAGG